MVSAASWTWPPLSEKTSQQLQISLRIEAFLETQQTEIQEYDEDLVRKLLHQVTVYDDHLTFEFKSGLEVEISM